MNFTDLAGVIWPGGVTLGTRANATERYAVLPSLERPRLLVPLGSPRAAAAVVRYSVEASGRKAVLRRRALAAGFRFGVAGLALRGRLAVREPQRGLRAHLSTVLGEPVVLGVHFGPARANRKPVAPVLRPDGTLVGYAKLGVNPLTGALVDAEAAALHALAGADLGPVTIAGVLHHGSWNGQPLLVQQPLPVWLPRASGPAARDAERAALAVVARCLGTRTLPYPESPYAARLCAAVAALPDDERRHRLAAALDAVAADAPVLEFGAWHGDWNGANSAALADGRVLVWDWERFDPDVPMGFDAVHLRLQDAITRRATPPRRAATEALAAEPIVAVLYLVELAARYVRDRQAEAGARLGRVAEWLLPAIEEHMKGSAGTCRR
jgi:hypothetical protein